MWTDGDSASRQIDSQRRVVYDSRRRSQILDTQACTRSARWCAAGGQARAPAHANRRKLGKSVWLENTSRFY